MANKKISDFQLIEKEDDIISKVFPVGDAATGKLFRLDFELFKVIISELIDSASKSMFAAKTVIAENITDTTVSLNLEYAANENRLFLVFANTVKIPTVAVSVSGDTVQIDNTKIPDYDIAVGDYLEIFYTKA